MRVIFLGGISRVGKAAFWPLLSSLEYTDQPINQPDLDWFNSAYLNDDISEDVFLNFVRLEIHKSSWFSFLGRNLNTNKNDLTNFSRLRSEKELNDRLRRNDNDLMFEKYNKLVEEQHFIPVFNTNIKLSDHQQKQLGIKVTYIHIVRNPIRLYNEWIKTKRVERARTNSSRLMSYKIRANTHESIENETADIVTNEVTKYFRTADAIAFENFCLEPKSTLQNIADKFNLNLKSFCKDKMHDANVPRDIKDEFNLELIRTDSNLTRDRLVFLNELQEKYFEHFSF